MARKGNWTEAEDAILREEWPRGEGAAVRVSVRTGRSEDSCKARAWSLGFRPGHAKEEAMAIVREIATGDPLQHIEARFDSGDDIHQCRYCGAEQSWPYDAPVHEKDCAYVRARALVAGMEETNG